MFRAAIKSLLGRKVRLLMSTFAIVLSVAFVGGSLIFSDTLGRSFTALFASTVGDVVVRPADAQEGLGASTVTMPADLVTTLEQKVPDAARVDGRVRAVGVYVIDKDNKVVGGQGPPAFGGSYSDAPAGHGLTGLTLVQGRPPDGPDEVVLDTKTAERSGYFLGEKVHIVTAGDQAVVTPTLVGLMGFPDGGTLNGATYAGFDTARAQDLFLDGKDGFTQIWVTAKGGVSQEQLRDEVAAALPAGVEAVTGDVAAEESATDLLDAISFLRTFLLIFAGVSLVVAAFLIVNTFSILVAQRSRELALLRALGASGRQVTRSVLLEALVIGLIGATLGVGLGVVLAMGIRSLFANFGLDLTGQPLIFAPRTVLACYVVGVLVTMAAAWLPARRTARIAPVQALRDDIALPETSLHRRLLLGTVGGLLGVAAMLAGLFGDVPHGGYLLGAGTLAVLLGVTAVSPVISRPFLAAAQATYRAVFGSVGNLAGQNSLRNPRRTTATASALMIGLALVTTMSILGSSAKASVDKTIEENFYGDLVVSNVVTVWKKRTGFFS
jgi:putative ABC transport system permease protein